MTHETIQTIIDWINERSHKGDVFYRKLTDTVARGKAWPHGFNPECEVSGYDFFFLFAHGRCIGAVLDMGPSNLHGYMTPALRQQGIMSRALLETVLPLLADEGRERQEVTFEDPRTLRFLERAGFTIDGQPGVNGDGRASIDLGARAGLSPRAVEAQPLSPDRLEAVKRKIRLADQLLRSAADELEVAFGDQASVVDSLRDLAGRVSWKKAVIEDANWDAAGPVSSPD